MARHELTAAGRRFALRPLRPDDAPFVVELRRDPELSRFINPTSPDVADQLAWTEAYLERDDDYSFVVQDTVTPRSEGTVSLYHLDPEPAQAEMGRWVLRRGSLAAPESALLAYRVGFERLGLRRIYCRTLRDNGHVVSFHASCGLLDGGPAPSVTVGGVLRLAVEQYVTAETWPDVAARLDRAAGAAARLLDR